MAALVPVSDFARQPDVGAFLMRVVGEAMAATFVLPKLKDTMERLVAKGSAHDRVSSVLASLTALHRIDPPPLNGSILKYGFCHEGGPRDGPKETQARRDRHEASTG